MTRLELSNEELATLTELLENTRTNLWKEISHTDALEFKEILRERDRLLMQIQDKLGQHTLPAAT